jgi:hypothetical protein
MSSRKLRTGEGDLLDPAKRPSMKLDLHDTLLRNSVARMGSDRPGCTSCKRIPLTGELVHDLDDGRHLCSLCLTRVPEGQRQTRRSERVHVGAMRLSVAPLARAA